MNKLKPLKPWQKTKIANKIKPNIFNGSIPSIKDVMTKKAHISYEIKYLAIVHYKFFLHSLRKVGKIYGTAKSTLYNWIKNTPRLQDNMKKTRKVKEVKKYIKNCIKHTLACNPLITLDSLTKIMCKECKLKWSSRTINRHVKTMGYTYKDVYSYIDYKHDNSKIKEFCLGFKMAHDGKVLISIDEA